MMNKEYTGYVAILGRPNVGKSTLLNYMLGKKISITSKKPQTTRHAILGIKTKENRQAIFIDTPGFNKKTKNSLHQYLNKTVLSVLDSVDVIVFVIESKGFNKEDAEVLALLQNTNCKIILVVNKSDMLNSRQDLLPVLEAVSKKHAFTDIVPISALNGNNIEKLENLILNYLPENQMIYTNNEVTDRSQQFLVSEVIREKLMRFLGDELPYNTTVQIEKMELDGTMWRIHGLIWVEKNSQKLIVIGSKGQKLKQIGTQARIGMEKLLQAKVFLQLWVKVKEGWTDNVRDLEQLGYTDPMK